MATGVSSQDFRSAMRRLAGAVTVVGTRSEDGYLGMTATAVCSLSAEPARILACINLRGRTFQAIFQSRCMSVNVLGSEHKTTALAFAQGPASYQFTAADWEAASTGAPLFKHALMAADCTVENILMTGSHGIVVGNVVSIAARDDGNPLLYHGAEFVSLDSHTSAA